MVQVDRRATVDHLHSNTASLEATDKDHLKASISSRADMADRHSKEVTIGLRQVLQDSNSIPSKEGIRHSREVMAGRHRVTSSQS